MLIIKALFLILGTVLTVCFIVLTGRGVKYDPMNKNISKKQFSDKDLWAAGYALQEINRFSLANNLGQRLLSQARLLYPENDAKAAENWARLYLARTYSICLLIAAMVFCAAAFMSGIMILITPLFGLIAAYAVYDSGVKTMEKQLAVRREACEMEFPNIVSKMKLLMGCKIVMHDIWSIIAESKDGPVYDLMKYSCMRMRNGVSDVKAISEFSILTDSMLIRKFAAILIQNIEQGGSDMTHLLSEQATELWSAKRTMMLKKGDEAAAKLLVPTMMILIGVLAIILSAALSGISLDF